jgi:hypothetical protein
MLPMAYELQRQQKFGKDTVNQSFTCNKSGHHVLLLLYKSKFLRKRELVNMASCGSPEITVSVQRLDTNQGFAILGIAQSFKAMERPIDDRRHAG